MNDIISQYLAHQANTGAKLRVWSLVVTIFGDAIELRGGVLRLGALQQITEAMGLERNALRTAMSRLAADGWLERQRIGRASFYRLSQSASIKNKQAGEIIYQSFGQGTVEQWRGDFIFALVSTAEGFDAHTKEMLHDRNFAFYNRRLAIAPDLGESVTSTSLNDVMLFKAKSMRGEDGAKILRGSAPHYDCDQVYSDFTGSTAKVLAALKKPGATIDGLDAMVLRTLLVHNWRRIVLKDVRWPAELRRKNWPGFAAQTRIAELYRMLLDPSEIWLDQLQATPKGPLPPADNALAKRFRYVTK